MTHLTLSQRVVQQDEHTAQFTLTIQNNSSITLSNWSLIFSVTRFLKPDSSSLGKLSQLGSLCTLAELPELAIDESLSLTLEMETPPLRLQCDTLLEAYADINGQRLEVLLEPASLSHAYNEPTEVPQIGASSIGLIPKPNELTLNDGELKLEAECHYSTLASSAESALKWLNQAIPHIEFKAFESGQAQLEFVELESADDGTYELSVTHDLITIKASSAEGFRNAISSLIQLIGEGSSIPCLQISDAPQYGYRGMMLDCCRHFHSVETVKSVIDQLARYKYNHFHWHLTDDEGWRIEIMAYPELTSIGAWRGPELPLCSQFKQIGKKYGGFYTQKQIKEVVEYAQIRGISVIPEIDIPGHCRAAIKSLPHLLLDTQDHSQYRSVQHYSDNVISPALEGTYAFLDTVLEEVAALFPAPILHIGADEVPEGVWTKSPLCQQQMQQLGLDSTKELQGHLLRYAEKKLAELGKRMLGWEEAQYGDKVSTDTVIYSWQSEQAAIECAGKGFDVVLQPGQFTYLDMAQDFSQNEPGFYWANVIPLERAYHYKPLEEIAHDDPIRDKVLGIQCALWCELIDSKEKLEYMVHPRLQAIAEVAWTKPQHRDWHDFLSRLKKDLTKLNSRGINYRSPW